MQTEVAMDYTVDESQKWWHSVLKESGFFFGGQRTHKSSSVAGKYVLSAKLPTLNHEVEETKNQPKTASNVHP